MPQATIVGAGIAGLAAALRLLERGFDITVLEQDDFLGGKLGAHCHAGRYKDDYHEHSYHMYLNWYHNFWQIIDTIGLSDRFKPETAMAYLRRGKPGNGMTLSNVGTAGTVWRNIFSGVEPPADMFLYAYSLVDLLGSRLPSRGSPGTSSVLDFVNSRRYGTHRGMFLHSGTLAKAFACPSYLASVESYRTFINYGFRQPDPMMWLLKGNTQQELFSPLEQHLRKIVSQNLAAGGSGLRICRLTRVDKIHLKDDTVTGLDVSELAESPTTSVAGDKVRGTRHEPVTGDLILAIPPKALSRLVDLDVFERAPNLGNVRKLRSEPMATLTVFFKRRLPDLPKEIVVLLDSKYDLSFLDLSQLWQQDSAPGATLLNVIASDFDVLAQYGGRRQFQALKEMLFEELSHYIVFNYDPVGKHDDIDRDRSHIQTNVGEELFTNEVGTWQYRPETTCGIRNLFIAGDYCKTFIDVVTVEGAVVSGLMAAEAVRRRAAIGDPIEIIVPPTYPAAALATLKAMGAPYAYAAKAVSMASNFMRRSYEEIFPDG
jgi:hypothetical protein